MLTDRHGLILRNRYFIPLDIILFVISGYLSFALRFETFYLPQQMLQGMLLYIVITLPVKLFIFFIRGMYRQYWKHAGSNELLLVVSTCLWVGVITGAMITPFQRNQIPYSVVVIDLLLITVLAAALRFSLRAYRTFALKHRRSSNDEVLRRVLIVGAGQTGIQVLEGLIQGKSPMKVIGFLDDDTNKVGTYVRGIQVLGTLRDLRTIASEHMVDLSIIALPSAPGKVIRHIMLTCREIGIQHRTVPGMYELATGKVSVNALRPISIEDLLRREPIKLDLTDIRHRLAGRCVMVTGAGGSIGSELSLQIAQCKPARLLLLGHGENSLFSVENKIKAEFPQLNYELVLANIQNREQMQDVFERYYPQVIFHAAAHKHVPMLESNVTAGILNNVLGTQNMVDLSNQFGVERMVMISTDKAVEPTNVMGMSKRVAEIVVMNAAREYPRRFAAVRFGNVLGSRGSVVPIFQQQIAAGGPVTITSDKMTRFFMSIPEAVLLVLKASLLTEAGPLFVLNMGDPVRIIDLAHDLIRLNELEPGRDIEIKITGMRPGEKLYEELFWSYEKHEKLEGGLMYGLCPTAELEYLVSREMRDTIAQLLLKAHGKNEQECRILLKRIVYSLSKDLEKTRLQQIKVSGIDDTKPTSMVNRIWQGSN